MTTAAPLPPQALPAVAGLEPLPPAQALAGAVAGFARRRGVAVVHAALVGDRAWGLPPRDPSAPRDPEGLALAVLYRSPDHALLGLVEPPDVIEEPADSAQGLPPLVAWEARRACRLLLRSNARVWEWLAAPDPVVPPGPGVAQLTAAMDRALAPRPLLDHALSAAKGAMNAFFPGDPLTAARVKYLHVARALMAAAWVLEHRTAPPPDWARLAAALGPTLPEQAARTLADAAAGTLTIRRCPALDGWIDGVFSDARARGPDVSADHPTAEDLDPLYRALGPAALPAPLLPSCDDLDSSQGGSGQGPPRLVARKRPRAV